MAGTIHRQETVDCLRKFNARRKLKVNNLDMIEEEKQKDLIYSCYFPFCRYHRLNKERQRGYTLFRVG